MNGGSAPDKPDHFLKKCNENFKMHICTDSGFLLRPAQNCKKCTFLDNLRTITLEGNIETRQMTPFLNLLFPL